MGVVRADKLFIFPSTYVDGERYMRQQTRNIVNISKKVVHLDFFPTTTVNPSLSCTRRALLPGQLPQDGIDLAGREFMMKLRVIMYYIIDKKLLDNVAMYARLLEFQKRGLTHAQCIFFSPPKV